MTDDVSLPGGSVKSISHFVKLDESCAGQEVVIRQHRAGEETCQVEEVYIGLVSDVYRVMFKKYGATFIMGLMLLVLALIVMVFGFMIQYRMKQAAGIVSISVAIAMSAGWIVTDSYFYPYIFGHFHIDGVMEFAAGGESTGETEIPKALREMKEINLEEALSHTGGSPELLKEILEDIAAGAPAAARELRQSAVKQDYERYRMTAHSMKGLMATIGAEEMSAAAKRHECAARNGEYAFIDAHCDAFAKQYEDFCGELMKAVRDE